MRLAIVALLVLAGGLAAAAPAAAPPRLSIPYDVELDATGRIFVADGGRHQIFRWDTRRKRLVVVAGTGQARRERRRRARRAGAPRRDRRTGVRPQRQPLRRGRALRRRPPDRQARDHHDRRARAGRGRRLGRPERSLPRSGLDPGRRLPLRARHRDSGNPFLLLASTASPERTASRTTRAAASGSPIRAARSCAWIRPAPSRRSRTRAAPRSRRSPAVER